MINPIAVVMIAMNASDFPTGAKKYKIIATSNAPNMIHTMIMCSEGMYRPGINLSTAASRLENSSDVRKRVDADEPPSTMFGEIGT